MIRRPPRSTLSSSSAASDVYKRQVHTGASGPAVVTPVRSAGLASVPLISESAVVLGTGCEGAAEAAKRRHRLLGVTGTSWPVPPPDPPDGTQRCERNGGEPDDHGHGGCLEYPGVRIGRRSTIGRFRVSRLTACRPSPRCRR